MKSGATDGFTGSGIFLLYASSFRRADARASGSWDSSAPWSSAPYSRERLTASFVVAFADPQAAAEQAYGRTKSFRYGLVFLAYKY